MEPKTAPVADTESTAPVIADVAPPAQPAAPIAKQPVEPENPADPSVKPEPVAEPGSRAKAPPAAPKPRSGSVTAAIIATVIIVLGLAILAVFAYLKSK